MSKKRREAARQWLESNVVEQVPLGPLWVATVFATGEVLLQYQGKALALATSEIYDLSDDFAIEALSKQQRTLMSRAAGLNVDGSIIADVHGLSVDGIPSDEAFHIFDGAEESIQQIPRRLLESLKGTLESQGELK